VRARLLELLLGQCIVLGPIVALWWFVYLDPDDRADHLDRIGDAIYRWTGGELRDWLVSPGTQYLRATMPARTAEEFHALGFTGDLEAFVAGLNADIDELEAEGID
jgi:hypothetical protein